METKQYLTAVLDDLEALADFCVDLFDLSGDINLAKVLEQPYQANNRSALIYWIGAELRDPRLLDTSQLGEIIPVRLAIALIGAYPSRWTEFLSRLLKGGEFPKVPWLESVLMTEDAA